MEECFARSSLFYIFERRTMMGNNSVPKAKIFFGNYSGLTADQKFGEWIEDHSNVKIIDFRYEQTRYGDHSIAILYEENE